jgi:ABC-type antimicrobial peptide transport system permease subunit
MLLLGLFGLLGVVIAAVGVYGVVAYLVAQRTREFGVRMALGATRRSVLTLVLRNTGLLISAGLILGSVGAWFLSSTAEAFLFRTSVHDPRAFAAAAGVLGAAAVFACLVPAWRAARVDPTMALRAE